MKYRIITWIENENTALSLGQKTKMPHYHLDKKQKYRIITWTEYDIICIKFIILIIGGCAFIWSKSWNEWSSQDKTLTKLSQGQAFFDFLANWWKSGLGVNQAWV